MKYMLMGRGECFILTPQNNTRHPQRNETITDRWVGRSWGWQKMIHHGLIHSLVTLSPNVSEQFDTLLWYAGSGPPLSLSGVRKGSGTSGFLPRSPSPPRLPFPLQAQTNTNPAVSVQQMSLKLCLEASFHVLTQTAATPDDYRLLQPRTIALIKHSRAEGCLQFDNLINISGKSRARSTAHWFPCLPVYSTWPEMKSLREVCTASLVDISQSCCFSQ